MRWNGLVGLGKLVAFTSIYVGPSAMVAEGYDRNNPYVVGIVELAEGPKTSARILGVDARHPDVAWIGMPLNVAFVDSGEGEQSVHGTCFHARLKDADGRIEAIARRRGALHFRPDPVEPAKIEAVLRVAVAAPARLTCSRGLSSW